MYVINIITYIIKTLSIESCSLQPEKNKFKSTDSYTEKAPNTHYSYINIKFSEIFDK